MNRDTNTQKDLTSGQLAREAQIQAYAVDLYLKAAFQHAFEDHSEGFERHLLRAYDAADQLRGTIEGALNALAREQEGP